MNVPSDGFNSRCSAVLLGPQNSAVILNGDTVFRELCLKKKFSCELIRDMKKAYNDQIKKIIARMFSTECCHGSMKLSRKHLNKHKQSR